MWVNRSQWRIWLYQNKPGSEANGVPNKKKTETRDWTRHDSQSKPLRTMTVGNVYRFGLNGTKSPTGRLSFLSNTEWKGIMWYYITAQSPLLCSFLGSQRSSFGHYCSWANGSNWYGSEAWSSTPLKFTAGELERANYLSSKREAVWKILGSHWEAQAALDITLSGKIKHVFIAG